MVRVDDVTEVVELPTETLQDTWIQVDDLACAQYLRALQHLHQFLVASWPTLQVEVEEVKSEK
jgi:hypothetical protein